MPKQIISKRRRPALGDTLRRANTQVVASRQERLLGSLQGRERRLKQAKELA